MSYVLPVIPRRTVFYRHHDVLRRLFPDVVLPEDEDEGVALEIENSHEMTELDLETYAVRFEEMEAGPSITRGVNHHGRPEGRLPTPRASHAVTTKTFTRFTAKPSEMLSSRPAASDDEVIPNFVTEQQP